MTIAKDLLKDTQKANEDASPIEVSSLGLCYWLVVLLVGCVIGWLCYWLLACCNSLPLSV